MTTGELARNSEVHTLVRVAFLLRLATLLASLLGFVNQSLTVVGASAIIVLALTSLAGLSIDGTPALLHRHPILVVLDSLVMTAVMVVLGTDNPLVLVTLSSCLVLGVVLTPVPAALSMIVLVGGYLTAALVDPTGTVSFVSLFGFPVTFISVGVMGQVFRVLAQRKRQSERALADLVSDAATAQERARLARELHDSTAKTLQGLALTAQSLPHWIEHDPDRASARAADIASSAGEAITRLRDLLTTLRHDDLEQPFHDSLAAMARDTAQLHGVRVQLTLEPVPHSDPGVRYELLAATREAIINAAVHSGSERVSVTLTDHGEEAEIVVRDEGSGFALDSLPEREREGHFGVRGYSERLAAIGGRAEVRTELGRGTSVRMVAPVMGLREMWHE